MSKQRATFGRPEEWAAFEERHPLFLEKEPLLHGTLERVFIRALTTSEPADRIIFYLGRLCAEDFGEILLLCGNGCGVGGMKILRGLYERTVTMAYIAQHPDKAEDFWGYKDIHMGKLMNHLRNVLDVSAMYSKEMVDAIEAAYSEAKSRYEEPLCKTCGTTRTRFSWSPLDLLSMAGKVGLDKLYVACYYDPTIQAHATVLSLTSRLRRTDGGLSFNDGAQRDRADSTLMAAHNLILGVLQTAIQHFELDLDSELQQRFDDFRSIWKAYREQREHGGPS